MRVPRARRKICVRVDTELRNFIAVSKITQFFLRHLEFVGPGRPRKSAD